MCCAVSVVRNCCFTQESCVDQIVEELTLCKVEYEKLVLAVDNTRHQLYMSGMDITSEEGKLQFAQCVCATQQVCMPSLKENLLESYRLAKASLKVSH